MCTLANLYIPCMPSRSKNNMWYTTRLAFANCNHACLIFHPDQELPLCSGQERLLVHGWQETMQDKTTLSPEAEHWCKNVSHQSVTNCALQEHNESTRSPHGVKHKLLPCHIPQICTGEKEMECRAACHNQKNKQNRQALSVSSEQFLQHRKWHQCMFRISTE